MATELDSPCQKRWLRLQEKTSGPTLLCQCQDRDIQGYEGLVFIHSMQKRVFGERHGHSAPTVAVEDHQKEPGPRWRPGARSRRDIYKRRWSEKRPHRPSFSRCTHKCNHSLPFWSDL